MTQTIVVTGAPGAGKTTLAAHLAREMGVGVLLPGGLEVSRMVDALAYGAREVAVAQQAEQASGSCVVETCAYGAGWQGDAALVIAVVDAAALSGRSAALHEVDTGEIRCADLVVLTRCDLVDAGPAQAAVAAQTDVPVIEVTFGKMNVEDLPERRTRQVALPDRAVPAVWSYSGGARLDEALAERFLKDRPAGVRRIKGRALVQDTGLVLDQSGRARAISPCAKPDETVLFAAGSRDTFSEQDMGLHFAEIASAGAATAGWFGFR